MLHLKFAKQKKTQNPTFSANRPFSLGNQTAPLNNLLTNLERREIMID